jgi:hypothetical protein
MRRAIVLSLSVLAVAACQKKPEEKAGGEKMGEAGKAPAATASAPMTPPARKPGLWSQTVTTAGVTQTMKICFDAAVDKRMAVYGQAVGQDRCQKNVVTPVAGGWRFESVCDMGSGGKTSTTGEAKGDFASRYEVKAVTETRGAEAPQMNGRHEMALTAAWEGPCPAGMKPGDMQLPGGMTINMMQAAGG